MAEITQCRTLSANFTYTVGKEVVTKEFFLTPCETADKNEIKQKLDALQQDFCNRKVIWGLWNVTHIENCIAMGEDFTLPENHNVE